VKEEGNYYEEKFVMGV